MNGSWAVIRRQDGSLGVEFILAPDQWHAPDVSHVVEFAADVRDAILFIRRARIEEAL